MSEKIQKLRDAARDQTCIVPGCGCTVGVVTAHIAGFAEAHSVAAWERRFTIS